MEKNFFVAAIVFALVVGSLGIEFPHEIIAQGDPQAQGDLFLKLLLGDGVKIQAEKPKQSALEQKVKELFHASLEDVVRKPSLLENAIIRRFSNKTNPDGTHPMPYVEFNGDLKPQLSMKVFPRRRQHQMTPPGK